MKVGINCLGVACSAALGLTASVASAQDAELPEPGQGIPACMVGTLRDVPQVPESLRGKRYPIVVAELEVPAYEARGFEIANCGDADANRLRRFLRYRDEICLIAASGNEAVQRQYEAALGVRAKRLCDSSQLVVGLWNRPDKDARPSFNFLTGGQ
ncbi:hypothetical protein T8S45_00070 [Blastomonas marina]|uniref:hypothetical protein n=1 Tax=Blastomonas marina TaxID=1867408 RepID=UPI002AC9D63F|nr:hypothetical protein [Blastomonas marina]WPZ03966.1 hypothetical protein T8S45_00070 [Blastomonas marina]